MTTDNTDYKSLFEPMHVFDVRHNLTDELPAVADGSKPIAWFQLTETFVESTLDFQEVLDEAARLGLSVIIRPADQALQTEQNDRVDVFVLLLSEAWRVEPFMIALRAIRLYKYSDSISYMTSVLLGYPEESCIHYTDREKHGRVNWLGHTAYAMFTKEEIAALAETGFKCFSVRLCKAGLKIFSPDTNRVLTHNAQDLVGTSLSICRFSLDRYFHREHFNPAALRETPDCVLTTTLPGTLISSLNKALMSKIEVWTENGWQ